MNFNESEDTLVYIMKYNIKNVIVNSNGMPYLVNVMLRMSYKGK